MDNGSFGASTSDNFCTNWNIDLAFDEQSLNCFLTENIIGIEDLVNGQEILEADPNSNPELINLIKDEVLESDNTTMCVSSTIVSKPASLPASQNWPGEYEFQVNFCPQQKKTKGVTWTYNAAKNQLYVGKEVPCPISFSTKYQMPEGVTIRATALYSSPESASEVVTRCVNHSNEDHEKDIAEADHLVRCESPMVVYDVDHTKRHSVVIPFENPPPGQNFSTYIFKFTCFSSCPGPNRRPLMLVFSLEKDNQVIGRQKVNLKICACPGRDSQTDEKQTGTSKKRKKISAEPESSGTDSPNPSTIHPSKKSKGMPEMENGLYKILVKDKKLFDFLEQMKKYYIIMKTIKNMPPDVKKFLDGYVQRKGYSVPQDLNI